MPKKSRIKKNGHDKNGRKNKSNGRKKESTTKQVKGMLRVISPYVYASWRPPYDDYNQGYDGDTDSD